MSESFRVDESGIIYLDGDLTFDTVPGLLQESKVLWQSSEAVRIDLGAVERCDSAGLALLIEWLREANHMEKSLGFLHIPPQLLSIAQICGVKEFLQEIINGT